MAADTRDMCPRSQPITPVVAHASGRKSQHTWGLTTRPRQMRASGYVRADASNRPQPWLGDRHDNTLIHIERLA